MAKQSKETGRQYKWLNRQQYQNDRVQQLGDKLTVPQSQAEEETKVINLFERVLGRSNFAVLQLNEATKEMSLYNTPIYRREKLLGGNRLKIIDVKNYLDYQFGAQIAKNGQQGITLQAKAIKTVNDASYGISYRKIFRERLDNYMSSNKDIVSLHWKFQGLNFKLSKECRENYLNIFDKDNLNERVFGLKNQQINSLKHSNIVSMTLSYRKSFALLRCKAGWDYNNLSYFISPSIKIQKYFSLASKYSLYMSLQAAEISGVNILKNDLLFRNICKWPGDRSKNFISPRIQFNFLQYPFLSWMTLNTYIFGQCWGNFRTNENGRTVAKLQFDYGIGLASKEKIRIDLSLLRMSGEKIGRFPFGQIKFSF